MFFRNADIPVCDSQARMPVVRNPLIEFANSTYLEAATVATFQEN